MSDIVEMLKTKSRGERNAVGDVWGDHICADAAAEITRLRALVDELKADRIRISDEAETEIKRLQSTFSTAREEGFRAGRLAGLEEAETKIAELNAQASSAWTNPTLADQAYIEGRAECVEIIRALKEKQP